MITFCSKCNINWARLWEMEMDSTDETVEFCPKCGTDMFLEPGNDIVAYIKCPITGRIVNSETGEPHPAETPVRPVGKPRKEKIWDETYEEWQLADEKAEAMIINRYAELMSGGMDGTAAYRQARGEIQRPERKFHFEKIFIL